MINVIKATLTLTKKPVWIWLDQIICMTINDEGGAVVHTSDGHAHALTDPPDEVIATIKRMLEVS